MTEKRQVENHQFLKYQYYLFTWGGFYNDIYKYIHGIDEGSRWFDTEEDRENYIQYLKDIEAKICKPPSILCITKREGYHCGIHTKLHRVIEWEGKRHYSEEDMGVGYPIGLAKYQMTYKWQPGFNDYPLGTDFDYENNKVKIIQEWITGAFSEFEF